MQVVFGQRLSDPSMIQLFKDLVSNNLCGRKVDKVYIYQAGVKGGKREVNPKFTELIKNFSKEPKRKSNYYM